MTSKGQQAAADKGKGRYYAKNASNQYLVEKFLQLKKISDIRGLSKQSFCYTKILKSLYK